MLISDEVFGSKHNSAPLLIGVALIPVALSLYIIRVPLFNLGATILAKSGSPSLNTNDSGVESPISPSQLPKPTAPADSPFIVTEQPTVDADPTDDVPRSSPISRSVSGGQGALIDSLFIVTEKPTVDADLTDDVPRSSPIFRSAAGG